MDEGFPESVDPSADAPFVSGDTDAASDPADQEDAVEVELASMKEKYLRLAAEYDNFRKRTDRERLETRDRAQGQVIERLLETIDDLQRVTQLSAEGTTVEALLEGVRLVERKLLRVLEADGLEAMDVRGQPFDPSLHEAIMTAPTANPSEDDTIGEVFQSGYQFRGNLLRPARVQVRKHEG